jgi:hypothetical protein
MIIKAVFLLTVRIIIEEHKLGGRRVKFGRILRASGGKP